MRRFVGFVVSLVLAFVLVGALFATRPTLTVTAKRDSLAHAAEELASYPFTPLISDVRVFSASWKHWVEEIDLAIRKKKNGDSFTDPQALVSSYVPIFRKGIDKIDQRLTLLSAATVAGPIIFWLAMLLGAKIFPKIEHLRYIAGRFALLVFGMAVVAIGLPILMCEDVTGLVFAAPTLIGGVVGWLAMRGAKPAKS